MIQGRHEYKIALNALDRAVLRARLGAAMHRDEHAGADGEYQVRSLYFDTPRDDALLEKIDGVDRRHKFRARRYVGAESYYMIEKKSKVHDLCFKEQAPVEEAELNAILRGDTAWMATDGRELLQELYVRMTSDRLAPKTVVDYFREPFICMAGNVRITIDRNIRTGLFSTDFLSDDLPLVPVGDVQYLLEVKYDQFLPDYVAQILQLDGRHPDSCSKYALCRIYG